MTQVNKILSNHLAYWIICSTKHSVVAQHDPGLELWQLLGLYYNECAGHYIRYINHTGADVN